MCSLQESNNTKGRPSFTRDSGDSGAINSIFTDQGKFNKEFLLPFKFEEVVDVFRSKGIGSSLLAEPHYNNVIKILWIYKKIYRGKNNK